jgi:hypothetical protein
MASAEEKPLTTPGDTPSKTAKVRDSEEANNAKINARMKMIQSKQE